MADNPDAVIADPRTENEIVANAIGVCSDPGYRDAVAEVRAAIPVIRKHDAELAVHLEAFCFEAESTFDYVAGRKS